MKRELKAIQAGTQTGDRYRFKTDPDEKGTERCPSRGISGAKGRFKTDPDEKGTESVI